MSRNRMAAFNTPGANPDMKDLLNLAKRDTMSSINCHAIGRIEAFNPTLQTAQVSIVYKKVIYRLDSSGSYVETAQDYPILLDCPVVVLNGGPGRLTFPIAQGDECLVLFNDRDFDLWWTGSNNNPVNSTRLHSFADAMVLVGVKSKATALEDYETEKVHLAYQGGAFLKLGDKVTLDNAAYSLRETLEDLTQALQTFLFATSTATTAAQIATAAGNQLSAMSTAVARIQGLLE